MRLGLLAVPLCLSITWPLTAQQQPGQDAVLRPLQQFMRPFSSVSGVPRSSLVSPSSDDDMPRALYFGSAEVVPTVDVDALLQKLHGEERDANRLGWEIGGSNISVWGEAALVAQCNRDLDRIAAAFARPVDVTAWLLPADGDDLPGVLDAKALAAALAQAKVLWRQTSRTQPFGRVTLANERWAEYVRDDDVEVCQGNQIGDPKVDVIMEGIRTTCLVEPLPGSEDFVLDVGLAFGHRIALPTVRTGVDWQPDIQLPQWDTALAQGSAHIQDGGAVVLQLHAQKGAGPSCRVLISARYAAPPAPPLGPGVMFAPVGALVGGSPLPRIATLPLDPNNDQPFPTFEPTPAAKFGVAALASFLQRSVGENLDYSDQVGFLYVKAAPAQLERVATALQRLVQQRLCNLEVQVETRVAPAAVDEELLQEAERYGDPVWRLRLPVLASRSCGGFVGTEFNTIGDFEVEIGQAASTNNPVIKTHQSGLWCAACLRAQGEGVHAEMLEVVASQEPPQLFELRSKPDGRLGLVNANVAAFPWQGEVESGKELDLGDGPLVRVGDQRLRTRQFVRMLRR